MVRTLPSAIWLLTLALTGCAGPEVLSPTQLNSSPSLYNGQRVTVRGYVVIAPEGHNLRDSKKAYDEFAAHYDVNAKPDPSFDPRSHQEECLTIANTAVFREHSSAFQGKTLVFRGRFVGHYLNDNEIDLGACPLNTAILIDIDYLKARYGRELNLNR